MQEYKKGCGVSIMADEVAHKRVDDVGIERNVSAVHQGLLIVVT